MRSNFLYPVALNVTGKKCFVVGGGAVGQRKAEALRLAGAEVTVLSLETTGPFFPSQLDGAFLVVIATSDPSVNEEAIHGARVAGALVNIAAAGEESEVDSGDFATMATVRRGDLVLAVTTGGAGPAATARLAEELSRRYGSEWELYVSLLGELRREARALIPDANHRRDALRRLAANDTVRELIRGGDYASARTEALSCLS